MERREVGPVGVARNVVTPVRVVLHIEAGSEKASTTSSTPRRCRPDGLDEKRKVSPSSTAARDYLRARELAEAARRSPWCR